MKQQMGFGPTNWFYEQEKSKLKFIRKALWPTAIVAAALMLFGALGSVINADSLGDVKSSTGDNVFEAGEEVAIYVVVSADADSAAAKKAAVSDAVDALVDADSAADVVRGEADLIKALEAIFDDKDGDFVDLNEATARTASDDASDTDVNLPDGSFDYDGDGDETSEAVILGNRGNNPGTEDDDGLVGMLRASVIAVLDADGVGATRTALATANATAKLIEALPGVAASTGSIADQEYTVEVDGNAEITKVLKADGSDSDSVPDLISQRSGRTSADVTPITVTADDVKSASLKDFGLTAKTEVLLVVVECTSGGFDISFDSDSAGGIGETASFDCQGSVAGAGISASKSTVYSAGSAKSVITVTIEDEDGTAATPGGDVDFTTNACVFGNGKNEQTVKSEAGGDNTIAEAILNCSGADAGSATVMAMIDKPGPDVLQTTTVTVIGPAAELTVDAASMMDAMACGEVATLTINVVDSAGQPVADGTLVTLTTNVAGVLVAPASTYGGSATAYLITGDAASSYAVVVQSGSAVDYVTVSCGAAAPSMDDDMDAPAITPPSTGDAGLAETSGSSWMLLVIAGALASVMVAVGKGIPSFFRR